MIVYAIYMKYFILEKDKIGCTVGGTLFQWTRQKFFYEENCDEDTIGHSRILTNPFIHSADLNALMRNKDPLSNFQLVRFLFVRFFYGNDVGIILFDILDDEISIDSGLCLRNSFNILNSKNFHKNSDIWIV